MANSSDALVAGGGVLRTPPGISSAAMRRRIVVAATIGNTLEWYDFLVYGFLSVTIGKLFFPTENEFTSLLLSVATFGVGFVTRPIGAVVLGAYADRVGRKPALSLTILIMALGTGLIAAAPTYRAIGIAAPLLIVTARLLQGFSCGGELGGATAILVEHAPEGRRGLYASWQLASQAAGFLLGAVVTMMVSLSMKQPDLEAGGWRWPFVIGLLIAPIGLYVRSKLDEPELFLQAVQRAPDVSITTALREQYRPLLIGIGIAVLYLSGAYVLLVYMPTYAVRQLHLPLAQALVAAAIAGCVLFVCSPVLAAVSDRYGRKPVTIVAALGFALLTYPAFTLMAMQPNVAKLALVQSGFALLLAMYAGPAISIFAELFPTHMRSVAVALVYNLTVVVVGGFAPFIVTWLIAATGTPLAPAFYVIGAAGISLTALVALRDRFREPLR